MKGGTAIHQFLAVAFLVAAPLGHLSAQWAKATRFTNTYVQALATKDSFLFAGTSGEGVFRTTDDGLTWNPVNTGLGTYSILAFGVESDNLFVSSTGGVFRSTDNGIHWSFAQQGIIGGYYVYSFASRDSILFAVSYGQGAFRTTDHGATWTQINNGLTTPWLKVVLAAGGAIYAGSNDGGIFRTTNDGDAWVPVNNGLPWAHYDPTKHNHVTSLCYSAPWVFAGFEYAGVYRSSDAGESWQAANNGFLDVFSGSIQSLWGANGAVLASTLNYGIYASHDHGDFWGQVNDGLDITTKSMDDMTVKGVKIFAAPYYGSDLWWRPLSEVTSVNESRPNLAMGFRLEQNFPNPCNPITRIEYQVPDQCHVTLKVYTMLGQEAGELVNQVETAGWKVLAFDASSLPSGVYIYRLTAGDFVAERKFVLLK